jgi:hypothetical protein
LGGICVTGGLHLVLELLVDLVRLVEEAVFITLVFITALFSVSVFITALFLG